MADANCRPGAVICRRRLGTAPVCFVQPFHPIAERDIIVHGMQDAARLGLDLRVFEIAKAEHVDDVLAKVALDRIEALVLTSAPAIHARRHDIMRFAVERRLPTITDAGWESAGDPQPLMDYEPDFGVLMRQVAPYVDRIL